MKSGTTFLFDCLAQHPQICPAQIKEPQYFAAHLSDPGDRSGDYERLFPVDPDRHRYTLDGSGVYTHLPLECGVAARMKAYPLRPRVIYTVRHPVDRIESHYNYMRHRYASWKYEIDDPFLVSVSSYHRQLQPYLDCFGKENILVIDFADLKSDPQSVCDKIFRFLGAPPWAIDSQTSKVHATRNILPAVRGPLVYLRGLVNLLPRSWVVTARKFLEASLPAEVVKLTPTQRRSAREALEEDMRLFHRDYGFDVAKWGF